jgi:ATP-dependent RNA helicase DeaD
LRTALYKADEFRYCAQGRAVLIEGSAPKGKVPWGNKCPGTKIEIRLKTSLKIALDKRGYEVLTPVQQEVSKPELDNSDLLVSAQTGSGKTVGFGIAIAPNLLPDDAGFGRADAPLGLVIAPTRELAMQVKRELQWLYAEAGVVMASCVGGMDMRDERRALERGAHIVVATPGRLRDHIMRGSIDLSQIRAVVLDEADEMLDLGFAEDLEMILDETP